MNCLDLKMEKNCLYLRLADCTHGKASDYTYMHTYIQKNTCRDSDTSIETHITQILKHSNT